VSKWLLFNTKWTNFHQYHGENKLRFDEIMMKSTLFYSNALRLIFTVLAHWNTGRHACRSTRTHFPDSEPTSLSSYSLIQHAKRKATHTNFIVLGLTRSGLHPTIYRNRVEQTNHYTTDAAWEWNNCIQIRYNSHVFLCRHLITFLIDIINIF
jgi:hypothetical protein